MRKDVRWRIYTNAMQPSDSPYPCRWESFGLEQYLPDLRPRRGTYGQYDFFALPPLPMELRGDWSWLLEHAPARVNIGGQEEKQTPKKFEKLQAEARSAGFNLPVSFVQFVTEPALAQRIRSITDCYLDLSPGLATPPVGEGALVRFLSDSQGCLFWYLYVAQNGDHAVLSSSDFYGSPAEEDGYYRALAEDGRIPKRKPKNLSFAAESFEAFLCRFWIENEIWLAGYRKTELLPAAKRYLEAYRRHNRNPAK